jgi:uncharacterized protein YbjT (DUF2867 family)
LRITIAGASGFIGKNLIKSLGTEYSIRGLSRRKKENSENVEWVQADLFSYHSVTDALEDTDIAIYLVHSMLPSSRLFQGSFQDVDLFLADNFAHACAHHNVKQIIYMGGLVPDAKSSKHLESRKEVEEVFHSSGIPTTVLRAGMVVGDGGSSFEILKNLVKNLPIMVLPKWTKSVTQAIYIDDLTRVIKNCVNNESFHNKTINVVNGEKITYKDLIQDASTYFQGPKKLIPVPINYTSFSKLWVKVFGHSDYELVSPLIDSLLCDLPAPETPDEIKEYIHYKTFKEMLKEIPKEKRKRVKYKKEKGSNNVRSIQRLDNNRGLNVKEISDKYVLWLPLYMKKIIKVRVDGDIVNFNLLFLNKPLLKLHKQKDNMELDRAKFHIVGGLLTKTKDTGWLEFRKVAGGKYTLSSINEFIPSLPWYIYKYSQALVHLRVMNMFSKYLSRK